MLSLAMKISISRMEKNMTMEELAEKVGVTKATVSRWESGEIKTIRSDKIKKIASAFGMTLEEFMADEDDMVFADDDDRSFVDEAKKWFNDAKSITPSDVPDDELWEIREQLRRRPEMRTLFSVTKDASSEDLKKAIKLIETLKGDDDE